MMLRKKVYPFPLSRWESYITKWLFTLAFIASDFVRDITAQMKLFVITAVMHVAVYRQQCYTIYIVKTDIEYGVNV